MVRWEIADGIETGQREHKPEAADDVKRAGLVVQDTLMSWLDLAICVRPLGA